MVHYILKKFLLILFCLIILPLITSADCISDPCTPVCERLVVAVDLDWPPYAIEDPANHQFSGVGVDLLNKIFQEELNIPVVFIGYPRDNELYNGLLTGDIDLLAATYDYPKSEEVLDCIHLGYMTDPLTILVNNINNYARSTKFADLAGKRGLISRHFQPSKEFVGIIDKYLFIQRLPQSEPLMEAFKPFADGKGDYILGSLYQWVYFNNYFDQNIPEFSKKIDLRTCINFRGTVYMAFSKNSKCAVYKSYLAKRLKQLREDGTIELYLHRYIPESSIPNMKFDKNCGFPGKLDFGKLDTAPSYYSK